MLFRSDLEVRFAQNVGAVATSFSGGNVTDGGAFSLLTGSGTALVEVLGLKTPLHVRSIAIDGVEAAIASPADAPIDSRHRIPA